MPVDDSSERIDQEGTVASVSRRRVLRRAFAFGIAAPVAMAVLQACGGGGGSETPTKPAETKAPPPATTGTPKPAGTAAAGGATPKATPKASPTS